MNNNSDEGNAPLIAGVGASTGGLEAFQEFLQALGELQNIAVIFVQHLNRNSEARRSNC